MKRSTATHDWRCDWTRTGQARGNGSLLTYLVCEKCGTEYMGYAKFGIPEYCDPPKRGCSECKGTGEVDE